MEIRAFRDSLRSGFKKQYDQIDKSCSLLSKAQLAWKPDDETWGVGECLYHLWLVNDSYLSKITHVIRRSRFSEPIGNVEYHSNWLGTKFIEAVGPGEAGKKTKVISAFMPNKHALPSDIVRLCLDQLVGFDEFLSESEGVDLIRTKMANPTYPIVRLQLGDVFKSLHDHNERHLIQVDRLLQLSVFPKGAQTTGASLQ